MLTSWKGDVTVLPPCRPLITRQAGQDQVLETEECSRCFLAGCVLRWVRQAVEGRSPSRSTLSGRPTRCQVL